jgi:hypothetical protein
VIEARHSVAAAKYELGSFGLFGFRVGGQLKDKLQNRLQEVVNKKPDGLDEVSIIAYREYYAGAVKKARKSVIDARDALKKADSLERMTRKSRSKQLHAEVTRLTQELGTFSAFWERRRIRGERLHAYEMSKFTRSERIIFAAEEEEMKRLSRGAQFLYRLALSPSAKRLKEKDATWMIPPELNGIIYLFSFAIIAFSQAYTLSFSMVLSQCSRCYWDSGEYIVDELGDKDAGKGDAPMTAKYPTPGRTISSDFTYREDAYNYKPDITDATDTLGDSAKYSWCHSGIFVATNLTEGAEVGYYKTGPTDEWHCASRCGESMCGTGNEVAEVWLQTVLLSLAITFLVSQPFSILGSRGVIPWAARCLLRRNGDFVDRVKQRVARVHGMDEMKLAETKRAEMRRDKRLKKEFKKRQKEKKAREEMRLSKHHQMTSAPEGMEMDAVGAHDLAVETGMIEPDDEDFEALSDVPPRMMSPGAADMVMEEFESVEDVRNAMIKDVTSHTYEVDEHEFMAAHLETMAKQQESHPPSTGNATEVSALKDRLMSGPRAIPPASTSMEVRPVIKQDQEGPETALGNAKGHTSPNQEQNEVESEQELEPGREPEPEPEPEPDPNELWMCPATGVTMPLHKRAEYLSMSPEFKECWQRVLASLVEKRGKRDVEKRVTRLHRGGLCSAEEAFCALAESGGDIEAAAEKLRTQAYRDEMALAARACELSKFVTTKRKKKKKKKKTTTTTTTTTKKNQDQYAEGSSAEGGNAGSLPRVKPPPL